MIPLLNRTWRSAGRPFCFKISGGAPELLIPTLKSTVRNNSHEGAVELARYVLETLFGVKSFRVVSFGKIDYCEFALPVATEVQLAKMPENALLVTIEDSTHVLPGPPRVIIPTLPGFSHLSAEKCFREQLGGKDFVVVERVGLPTLIKLGLDCHVS